MRTVLAAAAAGALIIGSAAGAAVAKPSSTPKSTLQLTSIDIKGHTAVNVNTNATTRPLVVRATVRDTNKAVVPNVSSMEVTLAQYDKKRGTEVGPTPTLADQTVTLSVVKNKTKSTYYTGTLNLAKDSVPLGTTVLLCLKGATPTLDPIDAKFTKDPRNKFTKKLSGGDCVTVTNVAP
jgi:hypothetical protein